MTLTFMFWISDINKGDLLDHLKRPHAQLLETSHMQIEESSYMQAVD